MTVLLASPGDPNREAAREAIRARWGDSIREQDSWSDPVPGDDRIVILLERPDDYSHPHILRIAAHYETWLFFPPGYFMELRPMTFLERYRWLFLLLAMRYFRRRLRSRKRASC